MSIVEAIRLAIRDKWGDGCVRNCCVEKPKEYGPGPFGRPCTCRDLAELCAQAADDWRSIESAPEGELVLLYCPAAHRGLPSCEVLMVFHGKPGSDLVHKSGRSYWTNGGPNGGLDVNFEPDEEPTHWKPQPAKPRDAL